MADIWGARSEDWAHYDLFLGLTEDLLPVVSRPDATIAPKSKLQSLGKVPSVYNRAGQVVGITDWTSHRTTGAEVERWARQPDYGICIQTRRLRAFDIDITDDGLASEIESYLREHMGKLAVRRRAGSSKRLVPFWAPNIELHKRVARDPLDAGLVELLATGQHFVAEGTHPSGTRYQWTGAADLDAIMETSWSIEEVEDIWEGLVELFGLAEAGRNAGPRRRGFKVPVVDPVADYLLERWETYGFDAGGEKLFIGCPWKDRHSCDSGPTQTAWLVAGSRGYEQGHFQCMHASCANRTDAEFKEAVGYSSAGFEIVPAPEDEVLPGFARNQRGAIVATMGNLVTAACSPVASGMDIRFDAFLDGLVWSPRHEQPRQWRIFRDEDLTTLQVELERLGFDKVPKDALRDAVWSAGLARSIDTAKEWLGRLKWDGKSRVASFLADFAGVAEVDRDYAEAISLYLWTALAGRVLDPGCKADMVPILVGPQGDGKSSLVAAIPPSIEHFSEMSFSEREDDLSRKMRGCLVAELGELRGLRTKELEAIKAWVTRREEQWTPKYKEHARKMPRRCVFIGTTNSAQFLADDTGERRWLPIDVGVTASGACWAGAARLPAVRDQLWAEGAELWRRHGVVWRGAVELAPERHQQYKIEDPWREVVERWLGEADIDGNLNAARLDLATSTVLGEALNIHSGQYDKAKANRLGAVMRSLGYDIAVSRSTWLEGEARKNLRKVWRPQKPLLLMFPNKKRG